MYSGGIRRVEPYCHGYVGNEETMLGRQIGGYSKSAHADPWRLFRVRHIRGLILTEERFARIAPDYNPTHPNYAITHVHCSV